VGGPRYGIDNPTTFIRNDFGILLGVDLYHVSATLERVFTFLWRFLRSRRGVGEKAKQQQKNQKWKIRELSSRGAETVEPFCS
jgi:hypothetical protein